MIIESLLDTDFYKFTMQQCVFHHFPKATGKYRFINRGGASLLSLRDDISHQLDMLCSLRFTSEEISYLSTLGDLQGDYLSYLEGFQLKRDNIKVCEKDGCLSIEAEGEALNAMMFEIYVLAIVSHLFYSGTTDRVQCLAEGMRRFEEKIKLMHKAMSECIEFKFIDFGTRRRYSAEMQNLILERISEEKSFVRFLGTSNVFFAKKFGFKPLGTQAHEFFMLCQALTRLADSQKFALETWVQEYRGRLALALTDTINMDAFLRDFDLYFAKLYDGCRQDSGDPYVWCEKLIAHYKKLGIDPKTKKAVFSDGLTFPDAIRLASCFDGQIQTSFGIGTNLTNDVGCAPLSIVMKMVECNGEPVAKISDSAGKNICDDKVFLEYLKNVFGVK